MLVALFGNIFSHSVGYLFVFFMVSFAVQKLLSLIRSLFFFHYSRRWVIKDLVVIFVRECSAYVFLKSFIVSSLTFRSLIHFCLFLCMV